MARVVVLDDQRRIRTLLCRILERMGHQVEEASEGEAALALLEAGSVDLLITDFDMPGMTGADVIERARAVLPDLPILLASGRETNASAGASAFLHKPFGVPEVVEAVEALLS